MSDQKAREAAVRAAMKALGYRHGNRIVVGGIAFNIDEAERAAIDAYLAALPLPDDAAKVVERDKRQLLLHAAVLEIIGRREKTMAPDYAASMAETLREAAQSFAALIEALSAQVTSLSGRVETAERERDEARGRDRKQIDYSIQLMRIIEAICHGRELPDDSAHLRHHKMALERTEEVSTLRTNLRHQREEIGKLHSQLDRDRLSLAEARARAEAAEAERDRLREALNIAVSRGCDHCADSIRRARAALGGSDA